MSTYRTVTRMTDSGPYIIELILNLGCEVGQNDLSPEVFNVHVIRREKNGDVLFHEIITCTKPQDVPMMLNKHLDVSTGEMLSLFADAFKETTEGLFVENLRALKHAGKNLNTSKRTLKNLRRRETICLRRADPPTAIKLSTTFHLAHNSMRQILYGLIRINEPAKEHVDNHFTPIDRLEAEQFSKISKQLTNIIMQAAENLR